jgi:hypothetical protein
MLMQSPASLTAPYMSPGPAPAPGYAGAALNAAEEQQAQEIGCYMYSLFAWAVTDGQPELLVHPTMAQQLTGFATARAMFGVGTTDQSRNVGILDGSIPAANKWEVTLAYVANNVHSWCPQPPAP